MLGHIHKLDSVGRIAQKGRPAGQRVQDAAAPLHTPFVMAAPAVGDPAHLACRLVRMPLIGHKHPDRVRRVGI
jgi:hypothetical protein